MQTGIFLFALMLGVASPVLAQPAPEPGAPQAVAALDAKISAALRASGQRSSVVPVDASGALVAPNPIETRLRIAPEARYRGFGLVGDVEAVTGAVAGLPSPGQVGERTAHPAMSAITLRELYLEYKGKTWMARAGQQAASWGLGIVAHPGARDPEPGEGFGDARYGDLSYRLMVAGRPLFGLGGGWRAIEPVVAVDLVARDDTADFWGAGDRAVQGVVAIRYKVDDDRNVGVYGVMRRQRSIHPEDTRGTDALVLDVAGKWQWTGASERVFSAGFELVTIGGTSTMARSETAPVQRIRQLGGALKGSMKLTGLQLYFDAGYASGDQNPSDDVLEGFRFDPDYHVGLVLFDEVLGYQSARASVNAANPGLVGRPPDGAELLPTRGSFTGAAYLFPRVRLGVTDWCDVYGGPLFAFATAKLTDPYATRIGGGTPRNALGGSPGGYLGTELDVGAQARFHPHHALLVTATAEAGLLLPGDALTTAGGTLLGPVGLGRLRLGVNL